MEGYVRRVRKSRYILAGILTALIFVVGLMIGLVIEGKRVQFIDSYSQELKLDIGSLQLQYAFIDQLAQAGNCDAFAKSFDKNLERLEAARLKLVGYQADSTVSRHEFELLRRSYILSQVEYWLLSIKAKRLCGTDVVNVLYFFSKDCSRCDDQSFLLTFMKQKFKDRLFVFGFDASFEDEPLLSLITATFNVTSYPTVLIEGSSYADFLPRENLTETLCGLYVDKPEECVKQEE